MNRLPAYGLTCVLMLLAPVVRATTIVMPTDEQLVAKSPVIVRGTVISSTPVARGNAVWTETLLSVDESIKGGVTGTLVIREAGGVLGDRMTMIFGAPEYVAGERVLAFLSPTGRGDFQTVDLFVGKFTASRTAAGRSLWVRTDDEPHVDLLTPDFEPLPASTLQRDADRFEQFVADRVAGRAGNRDYAVTETSSGLRTEANFTLIAAPTIYRWFAFDTGSAVSWLSSGTQPGYSGGGITEVRTAMSSWTSYSDARILYRYDGTFTTTPGGLDRANGVNEILLNDPLGEIAGTFSASAGGVVGRGGFNGVTSSRDWASPFAADADHPLGTFRAWNIVEGNLVIQDGVSPAAGMSSSRLAEIIAHEFGHTLGFGHSANGQALMYATVTGIGPSLRDDDRLAARWLYPNGSSTSQPPPPPVSIPAAPSSVTAAVSGSSVVLQWNDNANNESGQSIYYATATGAFSKAGNVAADQPGATITALGDGSWRFYVTAYNSAGESAPSNTASVTLSTAPSVPLVASFGWSPDSPVMEDPVSFTDTSTGGVTSRLWNFGDGTSSAQPTPVKRYASAGTYTISLTVYRGSESRVATRQINVASRAPALPPVDVYRSIVPVSAQSEGVGGSVWRTELTLFNGGSEGTQVSLAFVPGAGGSVITRTMFLSPRQSLTYANALRDVFGMQSGSGAIAVEATGASATPVLKVTSRTFNDATGGTYGLAVPDVVAADLQQTLYLTGIVHTAAYRTNIGLVNRSATDVSATLTLFNPNGSALATASVTVPARSFQQEPVTTYFPAAAGRSLEGVSIRATISAPNALSLYGSVVDNRTHDPLYIAAMPVPAGRESIVPVVGRANGINGTFWRSDVTLFNPGSGWLTVTLRYGGKTKSLFLMGNETVVIPDVVSAMGFEAGTGTMIATWDASTGPVISTRNYTEAGGGGTFGQSIDPVAAFGSESYVTGLRSDSSFRANLGFVNGGTQTMTVEAILLTATGTQAGRAQIQLQPDELVQTSVAALFPGVSAASLGNFTLHARSSAPGMFAYGSVIDNASGDPVFFGGR